MFDTYITIVGNVVDDPQLRQTHSGTSYLSFRVGSTARRRDGDSGAWVDGPRLFLGVKAWRGMAENAAASLRKGQPVMITGRLYCREYVKDETSRIVYEVDADAIGHDQSRGTSQFSKVTRPYALTSVEVDEGGLPVDPDDQATATAAELAAVG